MEQVETVSKAGLYRGYQALSVLTALLLILQPILIGQYFNRDQDYLDVHELVANIVFISVVAQTVVCFLGRSKWGFTTVLWNVMLITLVVAQIGLGYGGRDSASSREIHMPLGVLIFGLGLITAMLAFFDIKRQR